MGSVISWRSQQGFFSFEQPDAELEIEAETQAEKSRNTQLATLLPVLTLIASYNRFDQGNGEGIKGSRLARMLKIPAPWVMEAILTLKDAGYLVIDSTESNNPDDLMESQCYPAYPSDKLNLGALLFKLSDGTKKWLDEWQHDWPVDLGQAVIDILDMRNDEYKKFSMDKLIKNLPSK
jgi:hypothetical protein